VVLPLPLLLLQDPKKIRITQFIPPRYSYRIVATTPSAPPAASLAITAIDMLTTLWPLRIVLDSDGTLQNPAPLGYSLL